MKNVFLKLIFKSTAVILLIVGFIGLIIHWA